MLFPSGPLRMVHSSMHPKDSKRRRTSSSHCCLFSMPTKSFLSSETNTEKLLQTTQDNNICLLSCVTAHFNTSTLPLFSTFTIFYMLFAFSSLFAKIECFIIKKRLNPIIILKINKHAVGEYCKITTVQQHKQTY